MLNQMSVLPFVKVICRDLSKFSLNIVVLVFSVTFWPIAAEETPSKENVRSAEPIPKTIVLPNSIQFGGFIDSYYMHNRNLPKDTERNFTTQAVRNGEFNVNLAYVEAKVEEKNYRGRLAFQWGTSVNANYAAEVTTEKYSNQNSVKNIQEAYTGFKIGKDTWIDAGIFFGNIGYESWISQNNVNYTRAFALDYVPYYSSGVRLSHKFSEKLSGQLQVLNGWQNITDNNKDKSFGSQIKYLFSQNLILTLNQFVGNEAPNNERKQMRLYQNTILEWVLSDRFSLVGQFDVGAQKAKQNFVYEPWLSAYDPNHGDYRETASHVYRQWYHGTIWASFKITPEYRLSFRIERFYDPLQVMVNTGTRNGFMSNGYTTTFDILTYDPGLLRFEYVYRRSADSVFAYRDNQTSKKEDFFLVAFSMKF
ncbi:porin [Leptospira vanthielii]|uniref:Outer membrane protein n=1 Tax=Leptospira vanthielii serovar Holland str. Waz Holland = ATCC 700522 TaxID=1218591 RepID=N1W104_9LEPT|nr:outer membrane protein [Leptospira vanthielii serovar Holland str. Waz Holland = ATCC 700522]